MKPTQWFPFLAYVALAPRQWRVRAVAPGPVGRHKSRVQESERPPLRTHPGQDRDFFGLAVEHDHWTATTPNGKVAFTGTYLAMWRRGQTGWQIRSEVFVPIELETADCSLQTVKEIPHLSYDIRLV